MVATKDHEAWKSGNVNKKPCKRHPRRRKGTTWPRLDKAEIAERGIKL